MRKSFSAELMAESSIGCNQRGKDDSRVVLAVRGTQDTNNKLAETCVRRIGGGISGEGGENTRREGEGN